MDKKIFISVIILFFSITASAQIISLRGKVTNELTGEALPGATIISSIYGTSADGNGEFEMFLQEDVVKEYGLTVSNIGYKILHVDYNKNVYDLKLTPDVQELQTVVITSGAEGIVRKAYLNIPNNYLNKKFNLNGLVRMVHIISDSLGCQYYYSNNAKVKLYMSAYADTPVIAQVGLVSKDDDVKKNDHQPAVTFIQGYGIIGMLDNVHSHNSIIRGNPNRFIYKFNRKEWLNGTRVFVINYYSKMNNSSGILYIDTTTYAFVRILHTAYNMKRAGYLDIDKATDFTQYRKFGNRWILDVTMANSLSHYNGFKVERTDQFQSATVTTLNAAQLPGKAIIIPPMRDNEVEPYSDFTAADKKIPRDIKKKAQAIFIKIKAPKMAKQINN
jgi:hypothetical protein